MSYQDKLNLIDRTLNAVIRLQTEEAARQLKAAQVQTKRLETQYGSPRRAQ